MYSFGVVLLCLLVDPSYWDCILVWNASRQVKSGTLAGMQRASTRECWPREDAMELCQLALRCSTVAAMLRAVMWELVCVI